MDSGEEVSREGKFEDIEIEHHEPRIKGSKPGGIDIKTLEMRYDTLILGNTYLHLNRKTGERRRKFLFRSMYVC